MPAGSSAPRTLVVIPAKNEEASLPGVLASLRSAEPDLDVVVVDDGSTDRTTAVARDAGAVVMRLPFNLGIGGALRTGFRFAVRHGYDRAIQLDGDGQHDPTQIRYLLDTLDAGADMAVGNRFGGEGHTYELSRVRAGAMGFLRFVVRQLAGRPFTDTSSGFRAFNRDVLELFARDYPAEYLESVEALLLATSAGFRVDEVPVRMHNRATGAPSNGRLRLGYHYLRVLLVAAATASRRPPTAAAPAPAPVPGRLPSNGHRQPTPLGSPHPAVLLDGTDS